MSAGHTPRLASPEPDTEVEKPLKSQLQIHGQGEAGYAEHDLLPADKTEMS